MTKRTIAARRTRVVAAVAAATLLGGCSPGGAPNPRTTTASAPADAAPTPKAGACAATVPALGAERQRSAGAASDPQAMTVCAYDSDGHLVRTYVDPGLSPKDKADGVVSYAAGTLRRLYDGSQTPADQVCPQVAGPTWLVTISGATGTSRHFRVSAGGCRSWVETSSDFTARTARSAERAVSDELLYDLSQLLPDAHTPDGGESVRGL